VFEDLTPVKTSTGKIQKHVLRAKAKALGTLAMEIKSANDAKQSKL